MEVAIALSLAIGVAAFWLAWKAHGKAREARRGVSDLAKEIVRLKDRIDLLEK